MDSQLKGVLSASGSGPTTVVLVQVGGGGEGAQVDRALHKGEPLQICLGSGPLLVVGG